MHERTNDKDDDVLRAYQILAHPVKRGIIKFLGEKGRAGFSELQRHLNTSTGTLYYNLEQLEGFVKQDDARKYMLTEKGKALYEILTRDEERLKAYLSSMGSPALMRFKHISKPLRVLFLPKWLEYLVSKDSYYLILSVVSLILSFISICIGKLRFSLFFFTGVIENYVVLFLSYILSWLMIYALLELLSLLFHGIYRDHLRLFLSVPSGLTPLLIYPIVYHIISRYTYNDFIIGACLILLQTMAIGYLTVILSSVKKLRMEHAFIIVSIVYYICLMYNILVSPGFLRSLLSSYG